MAIVKISDLPLVDQPVEGTDLFVVVQDNVTKKAYASDIQTYVGFEEIQYATAGQTVFNLTTMTYAAGANNLMVFVDGVNQYEGLAYQETDNNTVTFTQGLHEGAVVKFSTVQTQTSLVNSAGAVTFTAAGAGAVPRSVQSKLRETVSVKDFGAVGDGVTDDADAIQAAFDAAVSSGNAAVMFPYGTYAITKTININPRTGGNYSVGLRIFGEGPGGQALSNCVIRAKSGFTGTAIFKYDEGDIPLGTDHIDLEIDHLHIAGSSYAANGIQIRSCINVSLHDLYLSGATNANIYLYGGQDGGYSTDIKDVYINGGSPANSTAPSDYGIYSTVRYTMIDRIVMDGCEKAIFVTGDNAIISNCHLEGCAHAITLETTGGGQARIYGNYLNPYGAGQTGWEPYSRGIHIRGLAVGAAARNFIGFNQIIATVDATFACAILLDSSFQNQIIGNSINSTTGVFFDAVSFPDKFLYVDGNNFYGCLYQVYNNVAAGVIYYGGGNYSDTALNFGPAPTRVQNWANRSVVPTTDDLYSVGFTSARFRNFAAKEGYIVTTPDGTKNYRIAVDNSGNITTTLV